MAKAFSLRSWATPLTIGSFLLMGGTGVLMFFELDGGLTAVVHQWFSWLFLAVAASHVVANGRAFGKHLGSRGGRTSVAALGVVLVASYFSWGLVTGPQLKRPIERALVDAPLSSLASVTHTPLPELVHRLAAQGVSASGAESVRELCAESGVDENRVLGAVFLAQ
ncbi:MAG TPA: DUF4405 domain-containing protein [Polyangiaceae bacterium]|nr:DUF4405 domain-containing protein [Polyangiaceae bacterium]